MPFFHVTLLCIYIAWVAEPKLIAPWNSTQSKHDYTDKGWNSDVNAPYEVLDVEKFPVAGLEEFDIDEDGDGDANEKTKVLSNNMGISPLFGVHVHPIEWVSSTGFSRRGGGVPLDLYRSPYLSIGASLLHRMKAHTRPVVCSTHIGFSFFRARARRPGRIIARLI